MITSRIKLTPHGPEFARFVPGMMRLGEWNMSSSELLGWLETCLEMGLTTFDHADIYGGYSCEELFGNALALQPSLRQQMELVSKCDIMLVAKNRPANTIKHYDTSKAHIIASAENSLKMLRTDYLDLLLLHRPDPLMDADEVAAALNELHQTGKVRYFGVSNFTPRQVELLASRMSLPLVTNQVEISVMQMRALHDGTLDQCQQMRICPMAWSPLGGQALFSAETEQAERVRQALDEVGAAHEDASLDQVALAWLLRHPSGIIPVLGTGKLARLQKAIEAEAISLSRQEWFTIWQASNGAKVP